MNLLDGGWPVGMDQKKSMQEKRDLNKDRYWYTPNENIKLRSMVQVKLFLQHLKSTNGNGKFGDSDAAQEVDRLTTEGRSLHTAYVIHFCKLATSTSCSTTRSVYEKKSRIRYRRKRNRNMKTGMFTENGYGIFIH